MAIEPRRGCGYRKVGGLYLVGGELSEPCHRLPVPLHICPTCGNGIKQSRGWAWIDGATLLAPGCGDPSPMPDHCPRCAVCQPEKLGERCGLIWIGERFYPTPEAFNQEAEEHGVSRRIRVIPRGFKVGETWVLLAHPKACIPITKSVAAELIGEYDADAENLPGIFRAFRPTRVEKLVKRSDATEETLKDLAERGITPVIVPDNDPDHQGTVYDDEPEEAERLL